MERAIQRILIAVCFILCVAGQTIAAEQPVRVTVRQLMTTPEKFVRKRVDVTGYYVSANETSDLLASKQAQHRNSEQRIWIEVDDPPSRRSSRIAKFPLFYTGPVRVIGTFHYQPRPDLGDSVPYAKRLQGFGCYRLYKRAIMDVTYLQPVR